MNSNLHLFWQFDICFPMCGILLPLTQIWLNSASLSRDTFSSWLNFQAPSLTAQVKGAGVCLPAIGEHQTYRKHSSKFFLLLQLIWTFCWLQQIQALMKDIFSTYLLKALSFPHSNLPCWDQWFALLHRDTSWHLQDYSTCPVNFHASCSPMTKGKQISPWSLRLFLKRTQWTDLFHILGHFWVPTFRAIYTGMILQHDKTLMLSKVSEQGYPKPSLTFRNVCLHPTGLIICQPNQRISDWKKKPGPECPAQQTKLNQTKPNPNPPEIKTKPTYKSREVCPMQDKDFFFLLRTQPC